MLVFNRAMLGTSISLVMRFADSVIKTFVGSACLYLSAIMDATLFGTSSWFGNSFFSSWYDALVFIVNRNFETPFRFT
jgi:hypothetical protein